MLFFRVNIFVNPKKYEQHYKRRQNEAENSDIDEEQALSDVCAHVFIHYIRVVLIQQTAAGLGSDATRVLIEVCGLHNKRTNQPTNKQIKIN